MKKTLIYFLFLFPILAHAQQQQQKCIRILNAKDSIGIANATLKYNRRDFKTDQQGRCCLVYNSRGVIEVSHTGYKKNIINIIGDGTDTAFFLVPDATFLSEISVKTKKLRSSYLNGLNNQLEISKSDLLKLPSFLGNFDLFQALKTLPGVGNAGEGNAGLYVRGGSPGQNLVLFNNATIFNPTHLLGLFSVFNTDFVQGATIHKSGVPASFKGRLSAVIDVYGTNHINSALEIKGAISPILIEGAIQSPINQNWSVHVGGRKSLMNQTLWPIVNLSSSKTKIHYDFYDLNLESLIKLGTNDLKVSFFTSADDFGLVLNNSDISSRLYWKNIASSIQWKAQINEQIELHSTVAYSNYNFSFSLAQIGTNANVKSSTSELKIESYANILALKNKIVVGAVVTAEGFTPNVPFVKTLGTVLDFDKPSFYNSNNISLFTKWDRDITAALSATAGIRATKYSSGQNGALDNNYAQLYVEPSAQLKYKQAHQIAFRLGASFNKQTSHLVSVSSSNFPTDFWMPATNNLPAGKAWQVSLGVFKDWKMWDAYVDVFYKHMSGAIEFNGGITNLLDNLKIEENIFGGKGNVGGVEFFLRKHNGKLQGTLSYTLSRNRRVFDGLNNGKSFPFRYDRPHDLNLTANYTLTKKWAVSTLFTLASGNAYTAPISRYVVAGSIINEYGGFNNSRMPTYHRLDLGATYKFSKRKHSQSELVFSVYNVYARQNPIVEYHEYLGSLSTSILVKQKNLSLLPILPFISYKVNFPNEK
jgi:hypothetical protein